MTAAQAAGGYSTSRQTPSRGQRGSAHPVRWRRRPTAFLARGKGRSQRAVPEAVRNCDYKSFLPAPPAPSAAGKAIVAESAAGVRNGSSLPIAAGCTRPPVEALASRTCGGCQGAAAARYRSTAAKPVRRFAAIFSVRADCIDAQPFRTGEVSETPHVAIFICYAFMWNRNFFRAAAPCRARTALPPGSGREIVKDAISKHRVGRNDPPERGLRLRLGAPHRSDRRAHLRGGAGGRLCPRLVSGVALCDSACLPGRGPLCPGGGTVGR